MLHLNMSPLGIYFHIQRCRSSSRSSSQMLMSSVSLFITVLFLGTVHMASSRSTSRKLPSVCHLTCRSNMTGTATSVFCDGHSDLEISGRCCLNVTEQGTIVLGIDLQECRIAVAAFSNALRNMSSLLYISLEGNNMKGLQNTDFHRNTDIEYLSLPPNLPCPGANGTWLSQKSDANSTLCFHEQNACDVHNVTCPSNSHCVHSGVDLTECICDEGFHGYKCMEQGRFPLTLFLIGLIVPTVVLCIFFYVTQRRYVLQQSQKVK